MAEMWISMGPQHPMTHGLWTLKVKVDGETIVDADPELGYLHRSVVSPSTFTLRVQSP
jgi:NADH-quinone oxidoreductase subunit D